jgi:hypothetical protein
VAGHLEQLPAVVPASVHECDLIALRTVEDPRGSLTFAEAERDIPFAIKRVYYLHGVPEQGSRGGHAHRRLHQLLIAASGTFDVLLDDGAEQRRLRLDDPRIGLHIVPGVWRALDGFSADAVCLVLASELYEASDYLRDYEEFLEWRGS